MLKQLSLLLRLDARGRTLTSYWVGVACHLLPLTQNNRLPSHMRSTQDANRDMGTQMQCRAASVEPAEVS